MKTILCVHQSAELYGSDRMFLNSVMALSEKYPDSKIDVILPFSGDLIQYLKPYVNSIGIKDLGIVRKGEVGVLFALKLIFKYTRKAFLNINKYDLVYVNTIVIIDYLFASFLTKKKPIYHIHELPEGKILRLYCFLFKRARVKLIFNSIVTSNNFISLLPNNQSSVVIENGIKGFPQSKELKFLPSNGKIKILLIGRIYPRKGHSVLLDAVSSLEQTIKKRIEVKFVGDFLLNDQHFKNELCHKINEYNLKDNITFIKFSSNPLISYNWSDIVVIPSTLPESFGLVAIEAFSAGRFVIASDHGGIKDFITNEETGFLFEPNNYLDLASKIEKAVNNPQLVVKLAKNGKELFRKKYTEDAYKLRFLKQFDKLII